MFYINLLFFFDMTTNFVNKHMLEEILLNLHVMLNMRDIATENFLGNIFCINFLKKSIRY